MAQISNGQIINQVAQDLQVQLEGVPSAISPSVQLNYEIAKHKTRIVKYNTNTATDTITIYTTPVKGDFYLTFIRAVINKTALCDMTAARVDLYVDGLMVYFPMGIVTLTLDKNEMFLDFSSPIKIDKNAAIRFVAAFAAGAASKFITIGGFLVE